MEKIAGEQFKTRGLRKDILIPITNDDVHKSIKLCPLSKELMSCPQMQRLRKLKQLGTSEHTYMTTNHTRFEHSLGVMHLAEELLRYIADQQPRLDITEKDIVCVKLAGLLHDLGHGPYSHVYDGVFRKQLKMAEVTGEWMGQKLDMSGYNDMPEVMDGWAHEDASLMMIDALLKHFGLEIDENNLDAPLKQIGDGIDAAKFGIWDRSTVPIVQLQNDSDCDSEDETDDEMSDPLPVDKVLTSRDWIFIKECIAGGSLPPRGMSIKSYKATNVSVPIGRMDPHKEFIYDIINNKHSGLDVDKIDYLARDTLRAFGTNLMADLLPKLIGKAFVARGECGNPKECWKCKNKAEPGIHLMICYPESMVQNMMSCFEQRYKEHHRIYTHSKTQRVNYMICDILLLSDPFFRLIVNDDGEDMSAPPPSSAIAQKLPISRAMVNAETYLELTDSVLDKIMNTDCNDLRPARIMIKKLRNHEVYERIGEQIINDEPWQQKLWGMSESDIEDKLLDLSRDINTCGAVLDRNDIIVDKNKIHHGMKEKNPVNSMRFLSKKFQRYLLNPPDQLPVAKQVSDKTYRTPSVFVQMTLRIFCRSFDKAKQKLLANCFRELIEELTYEVPRNDNQYTNLEILEPVESSPRPSTKRPNDYVPSITQSPIKYEDDCQPKTSKRVKGLFSEVKKRCDID